MQFTIFSTIAIMAISAIAGPTPAPFDEAQLSAMAVKLANENISTLQSRDAANGLAARANYCGAACHGTCCCNYCDGMFCAMTCGVLASHGVCNVEICELLVNEP